MLSEDRTGAGAFGALIMGGAAGGVVDLSYKVFAPKQRDAAIAWVNSGIEAEVHNIQAIFSLANPPPPPPYFSTWDIPQYYPSDNLANSSIIATTYPINGTVGINPNIGFPQP